MDDRLADIEHRLGEFSADLRVLKNDLSGLSVDLEQVIKDVRHLVEDNAKRPPPHSWKTVALTVSLTAGALMGVAGIISWGISVSPSVNHLERRTTILDHPQLGRVPQLEARVSRLEREAVGVITLKEK